MIKMNYSKIFVNINHISKFMMKSLKNNLTDILTLEKNMSYMINFGMVDLNGNNIKING